MNQVIVAVNNLTRTHRGTTVLSGVTLSLKSRERLVVVGPSGSGKTTLLRLIAGLDAPSDGEVLIAGRVVSRPREVLVPPERRDVALVFQGLALFPHLRALDQIAFASRGRGGVEHAKRLLDRVGLGSRASASLDQLSGGERQRIALARALAQKPDVLLMDEPFASLDDENRRDMRDLLHEMLEETNTALVLVTHSRDDALNLANHAVVLEKGKVAAAGLLEDLLERPRHAAVVRGFGLGQLIEAESQTGGTADTPFGVVAVESFVPAGRVCLLVRPGQGRIVSASQGVAGEIVALELRPPERNSVQKIAVVRVAGQVLRVQVTDPRAQVGQTIHILIEGACEFVKI